MQMFRVIAVAKKQNALNVGKIGFNQKQNRRTLMSKLFFFIIFIGIVIVGIGTTD